MSKQSNFSLVKYVKANLPSILISSILGCFVVPFFSPLAVKLYELFLNIGGHFITYISDSTYQKISDGVSVYIQFFSFYFLFLFANIFLINAFSSNTSNIKSLYKEYDDTLTVLQNPDDTPEGHFSSEVTSKTAQKFTQNPIAFIQSQSKKIHIFYRFYIILFAFACMFLLFIYAQNSFVQNRAVSLSNNIEIVAPYISDFDYKKLKSDFHLIHSKSDYDRIEASLEEIAIEHSLTLKKQ